MGEKVEGWQDSVATLAGVAHWHLQTAYAGLQKSLQQEWAFVKSVTLVIGIPFQAVEDEFWDIFLLTLFQFATSQIHVREITGLTVKQDGINLPDPTRTVGEKWMASCIITGHIIAALCRKAESRSGYHALLIGREGRRSNGNMRRWHRMPWERPRPLHPIRMPNS